MTRTPVNLVDLDFNTIKTNLKEFLKDKPEFADYNFEGSGLNYILDLLAYNSQNNAYLANMLANEAEIDSAILRSNVVSRAKLMGYTPKSKTSARATIKVTIVDPTNLSTSLLMPRGTRFFATAGNAQYSFITLQDYNLYLNEATGAYENAEVEIVEGRIKNFTWDVAEGNRYVLPNADIDTGTLKVAVFDSPSSQKFTLYEKAFGVNGVDNTSTVFWVYETDFGRFEIRFGDGVFGAAPSAGTVVYAEFVESSGPDANEIFSFSLAGSFAGYENSEITITTLVPSSGGADAERTTSIKLNAPRFFSSQGRAVTTDDFISVVNDVYPYAKSVHVWGGETEKPPQYGKVFISVIPETLTKLSDATKRNIERMVSRKATVGIVPKIIDPDYTFVNMSAIVEVRRELSESMGSLSQEIRNRITTHFDDELGVFDRGMRYSKVLERINSYSRAILSSKLMFTISKTLSPVVGASTYSTDMRNELVPGSVYSSRFDAVGIGQKVAISDKDGILYAGGEVIGAVDYKTGFIQFTAAVTNPDLNRIEVFAKTVDNDVYVDRSGAVVLSPSRLTIQIKAA